MSRRHGRLLRVSGIWAGLLALVLVLPSPASATQDAAKPAGSSVSAQPAGYVGAETCKGCHEEAFEKFAQTKMGRLFLKHPRNTREQMACENCHGPGQAHADAGGGKGVGGLISFAKDDPTPVEQRNQVCLSCHTKGARLFWQGSQHDSRDVACTGCHRIMERVSKHQLAKDTVTETCGQCHLQKRAQMMRSAHMPLREGKMTCNSCHNPHGTVTPMLLKENSTNDTCFKCHAEKRGPFLWQHPPVVENCANCHDPHGSNHEKMLKVSKPQLCIQCHNPNRHQSQPRGRDVSDARFILARSCTNCHQNIHGSNHPSGWWFKR